jgi:hypothetical protein
VKARSPRCARFVKITVPLSKSNAATEALRNGCSYRAREIEGAPRSSVHDEEVLFEGEDQSLSDSPESHDALALE